jgi:hypothetical protein
MFGKVDIISLYRLQQDSKVNKNEAMENLLSTLFPSLERSQLLTRVWLHVKLRRSSSSSTFTIFVYSQISHRRGDHEDLESTQRQNRRQVFPCAVA